MRIKRCYIENFGQFHNYEYDFKDGCNMFCRPNGWGKTTLTVFIRVMFYGFEGEAKKDDLSNERRRYAPWQGGVYGGELAFETGGKEYIIKRTFGSRKKEDEFRLYDAVTRMESSDYSCNIGGELFGIDSESFIRTVFISERDCMTYATDGINGKLARISDDAFDISNYEEADYRLSCEINRLSPERKTGSLYKMKQDIAEQKCITAKKDYVLNELQHVLSKEKNENGNGQFDKVLTLLLICVGAFFGIGCAAIYNKYFDGIYLIAIGSALFVLTVLYWKIKHRIIQGKDNKESNTSESVRRKLIRREEELRKQLENIEAAERNYRELSMQYNSDFRKYELLLKTRELLREARISFGSKYMPDVKSRFDRYYAMIEKNGNNNYSIDANMDIYAEEKGMYREISKLSPGIKDMAGLCLRMAFISTMYEGERPFLVLDDPFINMDDSGVKQALEFINKISGEYQVIYFTCHRSRSIA